MSASPHTRRIRSADMRACSGSGSGSAFGHGPLRDRRLCRRPAFRAGEGAGVRFVRSREGRGLGVGEHMLLRRPARRGRRHGRSREAPRGGREAVRTGPGGRLTVPPVPPRVMASLHTLSSGRPGSQGAPVLPLFEVHWAWPRPAPVRCEQREVRQAGGLGGEGGPRPGGWEVPGVYEACSTHPPPGIGRSNRLLIEQLPTPPENRRSTPCGHGLREPTGSGVRVPGPEIPCLVGHTPIPEPRAQPRLLVEQLPTSRPPR